MDIGAGVETIKDGEVFTITGVYAYDNRAKKALSHLQQFRVVGDWTAAAGLVAPRVFPAIITSGPYQTVAQAAGNTARSEEHTSELQSLMRISYAVVRLKKTRTISNTQED